MAQNTNSKKVDERKLQSYLEQFRKTFSLMMQKDLGIQAASDQSHQDKIILQLTFPQLEDLVENTESTTLDLPQTIQENEYQADEFESELEENTKVFLFWNESFLIVKKAGLINWSTEMARDDAREILNLGLKELFTTSRQRHEKSIAS